MTTLQQSIHQTTSNLTFANTWDHILARWGYKRMQHRVAPGLYALGNPTPESRVFVTSNYTLSFDALRSALAGLDAYILVLDTQGVNVWCAAGKGSFGTDELVRQIEATNLAEVVKHRVLILPQLGAPGVAAHEVKKRSKFKVEYGPVRAADIRKYLEQGQATPEMRRVRFTLFDRLVLIPIELMSVLLILLLTGFILGSLPVVVALLSGVVLFPILLPWIPTHDLSMKGFILGGVVALPFMLRPFAAHPEAVWWVNALWALVYLLLMPSITAYLALNFSGSTTFTSRTGVRREIFTYVRPMAWMFAAGLLLNFLLLFLS